MSAWKSVEAEFFCAQGNIKTTNSCPESLKMLVQNPVHGNFLYESIYKKVRATFDIFCGPPENCDRKPSERLLKTV